MHLLTDLGTFVLWISRSILDFDLLQINLIVPSQGSKGALNKGGKTKIKDKQYPTQGFPAALISLVVTIIKLETKNI